ncbi:MAG: Transcriptional regulator [Watsoniomyces obsoletus]|nr:MAG: Transcriptional regulator [Watsoniomyces obsoletus]
MNLSLVDPFILAQDYPETLAGHLRSGHATCLRFSHSGEYLASGRVDGVIVIFDVETNGVARKLRGHTRQMQSLSWSRDGRYLLSSSQDWKCILWDLKDGSRVRVVRFDAPVYIAELHPFNHLLFVASLFEDQPRLVDMSSTIPIKHILPSAPRRQGQDDASSTGHVSEKQAAQDAKQTTCVTVFASSGEYILAGTNRGWLNIIHTSTRQTIYSNRLTNGVIIFLRLTSSGREMVVNSSDRIIRTVHLPDLSSSSSSTLSTSVSSDGGGSVMMVNPEKMTLEVEHKFQDVVNRLSWNHVAFSSTGEYVMASTYKNHDVYVWERSRGSLVKILEGPKEELGVVEWHPTKPLVTACGLETGKIYIWSIATPQRWSALAPDFAEVEENVEYQEREDEFDIHPISVLHQRRLDREDEEVDVLNLNGGSNNHNFGPRSMGMMKRGNFNGLLQQRRGRRRRRGEGDHHEDEEDDLEGEGEEKGDYGGSFRMPVLLNISESESEEEIVAVGPGTMRRKDKDKDPLLSGGGGGGGGGGDTSTSTHGLTVAADETRTRGSTTETRTPTPSTPGVNNNITTNGGAGGGGGGGGNKRGAKKKR